MVRSLKTEVFGMTTVRRGYNELERRRVKTWLDAGVESTRELSEWPTRGYEKNIV